MAAHQHLSGNLLFEFSHRANFMPAILALDFGLVLDVPIKGEPVTPAFAAG